MRDDKLKQIGDVFWDAIIVGGGPAGLSASLVLGRCQRKVLLCDRNTPRNWASKEIHSFLTRDCTSQTNFIRSAQEEVLRYPGVLLYNGEVKNAAGSELGFQVMLSDGSSAQGRKLLIATGLTDSLPDIPEVRTFYGKSIFPCPYCDGWEFRNSPMVAYGKAKQGFEIARALTAWTKDLVLCTDGPSELGEEQRILLEHNGIPLYEVAISRLIGTDGKLESIAFKDGREVSCRALFFDTPSVRQSDLAEKLGCKFLGKYEATNVPGVFVAGNMTGDVQLAIVAAAEGAKAAFGINQSLTREEFERASSGKTIVHHPPMNEKLAS